MVKGSERKRKKMREKIKEKVKIKDNLEIHLERVIIFEFYREYALKVIVRKLLYAFWISLEKYLQPFSPLNCPNKNW